MTALDTWFTVGAFFALGLLLANSVVLKVLRNRRPPMRARQPMLKRKMPAVAVLGMLVVVGAWTFGLGAPFVWPESEFGQFMSSKLNLVAYFIWCGFAYVILYVTWHLLTARRSRRNDDTV